MDYRKKTVVIISLLIVNLAVTAVIAIYLFIQTGEQHYIPGELRFDDAQNGQYILYIGTNDQDTYQQLIPIETAKEIVNEICEKHVKAYTVSQAEGNWTDEEGISAREATLVYIFTGATEPQVIAIMDEVLVALNQSAILVERRDVSSMYYGGNR